MVPRIIFIGPAHVPADMDIAPLKTASEKNMHPVNVDPPSKRTVNVTYLVCLALAAVVGEALRRE